MSSNSTDSDRWPAPPLRLRAWGLLTAAGAVACAATVAGFLGRFSWFLDLFSHFRVQYLAGLSAVGALLLLLRRRAAAAVMFAFAGVNLAIVLPMYVGGGGAPPGAGRTARALLLNVNTQDGDPGRVLAVIAEADPDLIVLEEISTEWVEALAGITNARPHVCIAPRGDNFGIGLFSRFPLDSAEVEYAGGAGVPTIVARVRTPSGPVTVIATHPLPPGGAAYSHLRNDQLAKLPDLVPPAGPVLLLGDLNTTPWNRHFRLLLRRTGLRDSARGRGVQPTWPAGSPLLAIPLDHCLHSADIAILDRRVGGDVGSDHLPVIVDFAILPAPPGDRAIPDGNGISKDRG
ncbi:MAG: endonuclease/exonuclease/phosphatase family protein [Lentisphaerae bacterium]|nr:endonuclease/exonuclease/phosphatase family protein [Lentisphaerota bacterium]